MLTVPQQIVQSMIDAEAIELALWAANLTKREQELAGLRKNAANRPTVEHAIRIASERLERSKKRLAELQALYVVADEYAAIAEQLTALVAKRNALCPNPLHQSSYPIASRAFKEPE